MSDSERLAALEALLFVSDRPLPGKELADFLGEEDVAQLESELEQLTERLDNAGSALQVETIAGGWRLATRAEHGDAIKAFFRFKNRQKLSRAALETLAIVAYKQPATHPEIQEIRGIASEGVLKTLQERRLVRTAGRKDTVGKPMLYGTTRDFLEHFGLSSLNDLPPMEEFAALVAEVEGLDEDAIQHPLPSVADGSRAEATLTATEPSPSPLPGPRPMRKPELL